MPNEQMNRTGPRCPSAASASVLRQWSVSHPRYEHYIQSHTQSDPDWKYSLYGMQKAALIRRPLSLSSGCCARGSTSGDVGDASPVRLSRRSRSCPEESFLRAPDGTDGTSNGSGEPVLAPGMLAKYEGASLDVGCFLSASTLGVALVASS